MEHERYIQIQDVLRRYFSEGFEVHPLKIGWYNEVVGSPFQFKLDPDTLAFLIVSTPDMFEKALVPFLCRENCISNMDPLDKCMKSLFEKIKSAFPEESIEAIHDFEMLPSRRPKVLVQPAGHVAGAAHYYTRDCLDPDPFDPKKRICGVSVHPKYGGWFALRGVVIFKSFQYPDLVKKAPVDCVQDNESRIQLLQLFNDHWQDWRFRDIIESEKKYSDDQKTFFSTPPKDRFDLIKELKQKWLKEQSDFI